MFGLLPAPTSGLASLTHKLMFAAATVSRQCRTVCHGPESAMLCCVRVLPDNVRPCVMALIVQCCIVCEYYLINVGLCVMALRVQCCIVCEYYLINVGLCVVALRVQCCIVCNYYLINVGLYVMALRVQCCIVCEYYLINVGLYVMALRVQCCVACAIDYYLTMSDCVLWPWECNVVLCVSIISSMSECVSWPCECNVVLCASITWQCRAVCHGPESAMLCCVWALPHQCCAAIWRCFRTSWRSWCHTPVLFPLHRGSMTLWLCGNAPDPPCPCHHNTVRSPNVFYSK